MQFDDDDLTIDDAGAQEIGRLLGSSVADVIWVLGGPWSAALHESFQTNPDARFFVGRAGPSVGMLIEHVRGILTVGKAVGVWFSVAEVAWKLKDPVFEFPFYENLLLEEVGQAVDQAFKGL